jgi:hypothetical protein
MMACRDKDLPHCPKCGSAEPYWNGRYSEEAAELAAAAGVDTKTQDHIDYLEGQCLGKRNATIDDCAQMTDDGTECGEFYAAKIRALKDEP